jgi:hypothetical protein
MPRSDALSVDAISELSLKFCLWTLSEMQYGIHMLARLTQAPDPAFPK